MTAITILQESILWHITISILSPSSRGNFCFFCVILFLVHFSRQIRLNWWVFLTQKKAWLLVIQPPPCFYSYDHVRAFREIMTKKIKIYCKMPYFFIIIIIVLYMIFAPLWQKGIITVIQWKDLFIFCSWINYKWRKTFKCFVSETDQLKW